MTQRTLRGAIAMATALHWAGCAFQRATENPAMMPESDPMTKAQLLEAQRKERLQKQLGKKQSRWR